mmetsp:Transcript_109777/g.190197  ORF Transcript_109777/g.190197 Transcript_109777/m.190197 type:complete len:80 (+) Transcript_109777:19-258(+)
MPSFPTSTSVWSCSKCHNDRPAMGTLFDTSFPVSPFPPAPSLFGQKKWGPTGDVLLQQSCNYQVSPQDPLSQKSNLYPN